MVKNGKLLTPTADACLHGITRGLVLELARAHGMDVEERNISLTELYSADEALCALLLGLHLDSELCASVLLGCSVGLLK